MARKYLDTPPYVPKKGLNEVLEAIHGHKKGDVITGDELHKRGVSSHLIYPAMSTLKFLGLIDEKGTLLGGHEAFGRENPDKDVQKKIIMNSYSAFFNEVKLPLSSEEEIESKFKEVYNLSERLMNSAYPLFCYFVEEAGIEIVKKKTEEEEKRKKEEEKNLKEQQEKEKFSFESITSDEKQLSEEEIVGRHRQHGVQIVVSIQVNKYTTEKDIIKMVKIAKKAIHLVKKSGDSHL